jgi:Tfp pilus assembly protein PilW
MKRDESGMSLLEVLVTCLMLSIVMVVLFEFLENTTSISARTTKQVRTETDAQFALRQMTQELRGAAVIRPCASQGYATCVVVDIARPAGATTAACPLRTVTFRLSSRSALQDRTDYPTCTTPTTRYAGRVVLPHVVNGTTPLFTYIGADGNPVDVANNAVAVPAARSVQVTLVVDTTARNAAPLRFTATAALRNNR